MSHKLIIHGGFFSESRTNSEIKLANDPETLTRCLNNIADSSDHLLSLINNILDLSTIESGKLVLKDKPFNLADMLDDTASIIAGELQNRSVRFHTDFSAIAHPDVRGDSLQLKRVFINFLGNSVKFTPDGRSISFTASEDSVSEKECHFRFIISDTGIGMSKEFQQALFQPFSQELRANQGHYAGTGLGMHISKDLVEKMGGNVAVQSVENEGTTIEITLALPRVKESEIAPSAAAVVVPDYQGKCILLAEDNAINQAIALYLLKPTKANVIVAKDGQEAIDKFMASSPHSIDLILMDIMMPRHDGYEATEAIRTSKRSDALSVPILAMTANAFNEDVKKAKDSGMNAHLAKPIDKNLLYQVLALFKNGIPQEDKP
jgi:CheY-like chemotaxis protein